VSAIFTVKSRDQAACDGNPQGENSQAGTTAVKPAVLMLPGRRGG